MDFEIINKSHKEINAIKKKDKAVSLMTIEKKSFYFTNEACKLFGMTGNDKYLHLARGKDANGKANGLWHFVINNVNTGFKVTPTAGCGARVNSIPAVRLIMQATKRKVGDSFYLQKTDHSFNGSPVIEILMNKSVQQLMKQ